MQSLDKLSAPTIIKQSGPYKIVPQNRRPPAPRPLPGSPRPVPGATARPTPTPASTPVQVPAPAREGNSSGSLRAVALTATTPRHADSAGGGHVAPAVVESSWQRQYRLRKEAQVASGVKPGCRGCGGS